MEETKVEVPAKFKSIVDGVESLSMLELHELVKLLEVKYGVSAAAVAAGPAAASADAGEEKSMFAVELTASGAQKIAVIKVVKEALNIGLKEAKELVDGAPKNVKEGVAKAEADDIAKKLADAGAEVEVN